MGRDVPQDGAGRQPRRCAGMPSAGSRRACSARPRRYRWGNGDPQRGVPKGMAITATTARDIRRVCAAGHAGEVSLLDLSGQAACRAGRILHHAVRIDALMDLLAHAPATWGCTQIEAGQAMDAWHPLAALLCDCAGADRPTPSLPGIGPASEGIGAVRRLAGPVGRWLRKLHRNSSWVPLADPADMHTP